MKIGITTFLRSNSIDVAVLAQKAETLGFESLWVPEHPIIPVTYSTPWAGSADGIIPDYYPNIMDPFVALGRASAVTSTLKLETGICLIPERNPLLLAKEVATLDYYSNGRFIFGIGAGWLKEETEIMGGNFPRRWSQTREAILAMKELWAKEEAEFHREFFDFPPVKCLPKPVQKPHPPIILGGTAPNVLKRVVRWADGWISPAFVPPEVVKSKRIILDDLARQVGRDPRSLEISAFGQRGDPDLIKQFEEAGADRVIITLPTAPEKEALAGLQEIARLVLP